jgi:hypothetical protein
MAVRRVWAASANRATRRRRGAVAATDAERREVLLCPSRRVRGGAQLAQHALFGMLPILRPFEC